MRLVTRSRSQTNKVLFPVQVKSSYRNQLMDTHEALAALKHYKCAVCGDHVAGKHVGPDSERRSLCFFCE